MEVVFNECWVFRDAKCGICKPKLGIYKPYWAVWRIDCNFASSIWASARIDCEVDASFYEVGLCIEKILEDLCRSELNLVV